MMSLNRLNLAGRLLASLAAALWLQPAAALTLMHVHGLAYSADGRQLQLPSHDGLALYNGGHWSKAPGPQHDYMGFAATRQAIYSSGHPAPGSGLMNPFGLIKSGDGGRSWQKLGLEGEADFHLLAASYGGNAVYVVNGRANSQMPAPGLYATTDDGRHWRRAAAAGLDQGPSALAVHPQDPRVVAAATGSGLWVSTDGGERFQPLTQGTQGVSVAFSLDGASLWFGSYRGGAALARVDWKARKFTPVALPALGQDAVAYLAQNPARPQEWTFASFNRNVYQSTDAGQHWMPLVRDGETLR